MERARVRLKTVAWFPLFSLPLLLLVPYWLHRQFEGPVARSVHSWEWVGIWLVLNGMGLALWCVNLLNLEGQGTPVPWDPPKRFVTTGPYRMVRNPMALGLLLIFWCCRARVKMS